MQKIVPILKLARLHRPIGIFLLLWPTLWALWLANHGHPPLKLLIIFVLGAVLTRSAGCVINDIWDRKFDRHVARTQDRPLTSGQLSLKTALVSLMILSLLSLALALLLNPFAFRLCLLAALLATLYPLMKRITYFPQVFFGPTYSMGILIAYAASQNYLPWPAFLLFFLNAIWALAYDTAYAITDQKDDIKIGIKSTALFFKSRSPLFVGILEGLVVLGLVWVGRIENLSVPYFVSLILSVGFFIYQQKLIRQDLAFQAFLNNQWVGFIIFLGIVLGS